MAKSLYLINPRAKIPGYFGSEVFEHWGLPPATGIADLTTTTVAAFAPPDWRVTICDEHLTPVDLDKDADFVGLTGKVTQVPRLIELAGEFRRRGKRVIAGGPYASLAPSALRPHVDVLVVGELESIAGTLFADLERGQWQAEYVGDKADLADSPRPRWDLYPNERALIGCVQTSRGCPFDCEFCDVIAYLGRKQRHKPVPHVLAELDALYALGYRNVFLADDNFTVYRRRAHEILAALAAWNRDRPDGPVFFSTQVSIDAARDPALVEACAQAGIDWVFIGLETPNQESLKECRKPQNVGVDLLERVDVFLRHGISVTGGMIVGFDHDGPDIFRRQYDFAMRSAIPVFSLGALVAPVATALYRRLHDANRLLEGSPEVAACPWDTNIVAARLERSELLNGLRQLSNALYRPAEFAERTIRMIEGLAPHPLHDAAVGRVPRSVETDAVLVTKRMTRLGPEESRMLRTVLRALNGRPHTARAAMTALYRYAQIRCMYDTGRYWDPHLVAPDAAAVQGREALPMDAAMAPRPEYRPIVDARERRGNGRRAGGA